MLVWGREREETNILRKAESRNGEDQEATEPALTERQLLEMGLNCCREQGGNGRSKRARSTRMVHSGTREPLLKDTEREAVSTLLRFLEQGG